ncbi:EAL domain-containing protein [uncultured Psychrosphaera sp.]|uniref:EAL domain-containing protein n=1 Tax=uncultured Psychrosphaera sp. TaxID=1403522 RepID=UPI0026206B57|nr:EAL domain-containing protein [uncultured Psychrosphaera sp.]
MSKFNKWVLILFITFPILFLLTKITTSLTSLNNLSLGQNDISIDIRYKYLTDNNNDLTLNQVVSRLDEFDEVPLNKAKTDFGNIGFWYQIDIINTLNRPRELTLFFDNPMIDIINIYKHVGEQYTFVRSLGDSNLANSKEKIGFPNYKINLQAKQEFSFLIYTSTAGPANLPISIFDTVNFYKFKDAVYLIWGAFIGIVIVMSVYNLILFVGTQERIYVMYIGYIATFLIELSIVHGYGAYIMPLPLFDFISKNIISVNFLLAYFSLMFALHFLKFNEEPERKITRYVNVLSNLNLVFGVLALFVVEYIAAQFFFTLQMFLYALGIIMMYVKIKEGVKWANFYIISWLPLLIGAAVGPLLLTGHIEYSFWSRHALLFGVIFEITFMAMALAQRLRISEQERLYQASHDHVFGFANNNLLEIAVESIVEKQKNASFSVVIVSIAKYESIVPYLPTESLKTIIYQFITDVEHELSNELLLIDIDSKNEYSKTAMIREGVFAFLVSSNDEHLLQNIMNDFASQQPISYSSDGLSINIKCLIGASTNTKSIKSTNELVNKAQQAIELAIEKGNLYGIYDDQFNSNDQRKVQLASDLQTAIDENTLQLYHQPQTNIATGEVIGSEVLLRWIHPSYGFIPPDEFVRIAEDTGIINKLSEWVFNQSCIHLVELLSLGIKNQVVSVNMSVHDVMHNGFITYLIRTINKYDLRAELFVLELTETVSVTDTKKFTRNMLELKDIGFSLAIDDFGTGYSSLTYVSKHPFDKLKIDREFIQFLDQSEKDFTIVSATINMANSLGLDVVAEGVEDQKTLDLLKSLNCEMAQGYHISRPLPFSAYIEWLDEESNKI